MASLRENFDILDADDARRMLRRVMKALNLSTDEDEGGRRDPVKIVAGHIAKFKDRLMTPKAAAAHVQNRIAEANRAKAPIDAAGLLAAASAYGEYQARLREANAADFGDLLLWPTLALFHDADYRAQWSGKFEPLAKFIERGEFSLCSRGGAAGAQAGAGLSCVTRSI